MAREMSHADSSKQTEISFLGTDISSRTDVSLQTDVSFGTISKDISGLSTDASFPESSSNIPEHTSELCNDQAGSWFKPTICSTPHRTNREWTVNSWGDSSLGETELHEEPIIQPLAAGNPHCEVDSMKLYLDITPGESTLRESSGISVGPQVHISSIADDHQADVSSGADNHQEYTSIGAGDQEGISGGSEDHQADVSSGVVGVDDSQAGIPTRAAADSRADISHGTEDHQENISSGAVRAADSQADISIEANDPQTEISTEQDDMHLARAKRECEQPALAGRWKKRCEDHVTSDSFIEILNSQCCQRRCNQSLSFNDLENSFKGVKDMTESEIKQFALSQIWTHCHISWEGNRTKPNINYRFVICGKIVCEKAFCRCYNISMKVFKDCIKSFLCSKRNMIHGNKGVSRMREKTTQALTWMRYTFQQVGDYMPHKEEVLLPISQSKTSLYDKMREEFLAQNITDIITKEYFMAVWNVHFPAVKIGKCSGFTVCGICQSLKQANESAVLEVERKECRDLKKLHLGHVQTERDQYHLARYRAGIQPAEVTTIIVDGMDQSKTDLPHFAQSDKDTKHLAKLTTHITGVLLHTRAPYNKFAYVYTDFKHIPHDSNLTIHAILRTLSKHRDVLGRELFIQLDNCFRENKNRYVLSFCSLLVELKVFQKVTVHFLPVGHTHEDVDQMFSCVAKALQKRNVYTFEDLCSFVKGSYTPAIEVEDVPHLLNVKEWLTPHLAGTFSNHSKPLWFEFTPGTGRAVMRYKMWHHDPWLPDGEGLYCLKSIPCLDQCPQWVEPCLERVDLPSLEKDIPDRYNNRIPPAKKEDLRRMLEDISNLDELPPPVRTWTLPELDLWETRRQKQQPPQDLQPLRERIEAACLPVTIGTQGRTEDPAILEADFSSIQVNDHVAINLIDSSKRPYLGKVLSIDGDDCTLSWLKGSWSGGWKQWYRKNGSDMEPYLSTVPLQSILLWGFNFTAKNRLPKRIAVELKERYAATDEEAALND